MRNEFDMIVAGAGYAGSLMAMIARRLGLTVALIERGRHPRFAIGESSTPLANLLLEDLAKKFDLPRIQPLSKWGTWQREHPEIACGLKRGFTFYHHRPGEPFSLDSARDRQLMVGASPNDAIADTHWFREDLDAYLVNEARLLGIDYRDDFAISQIELSRSRVVLRGRQDDRETGIGGRLLVDATGPRGLLFRHLNLRESPLPDHPLTHTLYAHFRNVAKCGDCFPPPEMPPYPPDEAAVHHVFPGGWIWVLRFNNGITSAGVSATDALAGELGLPEGANGWARLLDRFPSVGELFADATPCRPFVHQSPVAFRSAQTVGPRWVMLPSAAGFVDPLLSTGFPLTLLGIERIAGMLQACGTPDLDQGALRQYAAETDAELGLTARLTGALFARLADPVAFNAVTLIYFAAASYSEAARRLNRSELAPGFLLHGRKDIGGRLGDFLVTLARSGDAGNIDWLRKEIGELIGPINVAGLGDSGRRNWYAARAEDLLAGAPKLGSSEAEVLAMLASCGMALETATK